MPVKLPAAKRLLAHPVKALLCGVALLLSQPLSATVEPLKLGDQSGLTQALLHAADEDQHLAYALVQEMLAHQALRYVPIESSVIASQQHLADLFASERLIPRPLQVGQIFDDRFNPLLPNHP
jgi:hypothetical protein